jgi:hypothetical protein
MMFCGDSVGALPGTVLRGLDAQSHLLGQRSADGTADRVILPVRGFCDLSRRGAIFPA